MKKILIFGFSRNQTVFLSPAIRNILGDCIIYTCDNALEITQSKEPYDVICINSAMHFWELDSALMQAKMNVKSFIMALSLQQTTPKNISLLLTHGIKYILVNLEQEIEFNHCKQAVQNKKLYHSKGSLALQNQNYDSTSDIYRKLSDKQKCAFHYMMSGKTLKEFCSDMGYNSLSTASTHWHKVLEKYQVTSVIKLRNKF